MKLDIGPFVEKIIPPNNREHREGFSNEHYIDQLNSSERELVEDALIVKLTENKNDLLIITTLSYLKSTKSLPILYNLLDEPSNEVYKNNLYKLVVASSIYEISADDKLIDFAIEEFKKVSNMYDILHAFYYLSKFKNARTNNVIGSYTDDKEYLIAYNAKRHWVKSL